MPPTILCHALFVHSTRGTRTRSSSPPVPRTALTTADGVSHSVQGENDICSPPHVRAIPTERGPPSRGSRNNSRRRLRRETLSPVATRSRVEHEHVQPQEGSRRFDDDDDNQRKKIAAVVETGERFGRQADRNDSRHRHRVPAVGVLPGTFGSERYLDKRRQRAAQGEEVVRQLGQELNKISTQ